MDQIKPSNSIFAFVKKEEIISNVEAQVQKLFEGEGTGHDWFHIDRVRKNAIAIGVKESADLYVVELAALLHDIADHKFHDHDLSVGPKQAHEMVLNCGGDHDLAIKVAEIVSQVSYKGAGVDTPAGTLEAGVVQDADRLDALGAIGIARAFAYGGSKHREIYNPDREPNLHNSFDSYAKDEGTTVNHFYEKLLLLQDRMQTKTGKEMAEKSHDFMVDFLERFYAEWNCEL